MLCGAVFRRLRLEIIDFLLHFKISSPGLSGLELSCYSGLFFSSKFCLNFAQLNPWKICQLSFHYVEEPLSDELVFDDNGLSLQKGIINQEVIDDRDDDHKKLTLLWTISFV